MEVFKFGGSLIDSGEDFLRILSVMEKLSPQVVVVSAIKGATNLLEQGRFREFRSRHEKILQQLGLPPMSWAPHPESLPPGEALAMGEMACSHILSSLARDYTLLDVREVMRTDSLPLTDFLMARRWGPELARGTKIITQGFLGRNARGESTTLEREGSDYTATLLGACFKAKRVVIYTDVPGIFECDPRLLPQAAPCPHLSYHEARAFALAGAKVLFPRAVEPLMELAIPLVVSSLDGQGHTLVDAFTPPPRWVGLVATPRAGPWPIHLIGQDISQRAQECGRLLWPCRQVSSERHRLSFGAYGLGGALWAWEKFTGPQGLGRQETSRELNAPL